MRIPGIQKVGYGTIADLPINIGIDAMNDVPISLVFHVTRILINGDAECSVEQTDDNNGSAEKVKLTFKADRRIPLRTKLFFCVTCSDGHSYLIGTKESVPSIKQNDTIAAPNGHTVVAVTVELTAPKAWIPLDSIDSSETQAIPFIQWREATEQEIDDMIDNIEEPATSINAKILITLRLLDRAFKRLWQKLSTDIPAHTHTTDQVKMADNPSKTLTAELEKIRKIAAAGL